MFLSTILSWHSRYLIAIYINIKNSVFFYTKSIYLTHILLFSNFNRIFPHNYFTHVFFRCFVLIITLSVIESVHIDIYTSPNNSALIVLLVIVKNGILLNLIYA